MYFGHAGGHGGGVAAAGLRAGVPGQLRPPRRGVGGDGHLRRRPGRRPARDVAAGQAGRAGPGRAPCFISSASTCCSSTSRWPRRLWCCAPTWPALATVLWVAVMANSVNFIDGLDGLAAGIVAIGAGAFFVYSHQLGRGRQHPAEQRRPAHRGDAVGLCVGFLPHNFHPARIFMGDAGAMLLGRAGGRVDPGGRRPGQLPVQRPDLLFLRADHHPVLHPRDPAAGHRVRHRPPGRPADQPCRRRPEPPAPPPDAPGPRPPAAVLILWAWTALLSGLVLWPGITDSHNEIPPIAVGALPILLYTLFAPGAARRSAMATTTAMLATGPTGMAASPTRGGPGSRVTAPTPQVGPSRRTFAGKPPSRVPGARGRGNRRPRQRRGQARSPEPSQQQRCEAGLARPSDPSSRPARRRHAGRGHTENGGSGASGPRGPLTLEQEPAMAPGQGTVSGVAVLQACFVAWPGVREQCRARKRYGAVEVARRCYAPAALT